jgi:hypothetical protein
MDFESMNEDAERRAGLRRSKTRAEELAEQQVMMERAIQGIKEMGHPNKIQNESSIKSRERFDIFKERIQTAKKISPSLSCRASKGPTTRY